MLFTPAPVVGGAAAFDHVAGQRPGAAGKPDQRHAALQRMADRGDGVEHVAQLFEVGHGQRGDVGLVAQRTRQLRALALGEAQPQAHGVGHGQDVGEQDGGVEREALQRLQRHLGRVVDVRGQAHEAAGAGPRGLVFGQVAAGLAHQPEGV
jgi:hypothetical protein